MRKAASIFAAVSALAATCLFAAGGAEGLTPPPLDGAKVVFDNGGRIVSMNADGSGRTYLTRGDRKATWAELFGQNGDADPKVSPDGSRMVFIRSSGVRSYHGKDRLMLAHGDGSGAKPILPKLKLHSLNSPNWTPDGTRLIVVRRKWVRDTVRFSVATVKPNGSGLKTIFRLPAQKEGPKQDTYFEPEDPVISPDGKWLLVEVDDRFMDNANHLEVVDLASGKRRSLGRQTYSGSWSADGKSIAFVSARGSKTEFCEEIGDHCFDSGDIFTANLDGTGRKRLTRTGANEDRPSWSPAGDRILFTSNEAMPESLAATEIYSMNADGSCPVALTNGAPGSFSPSWTGGDGSTVVNIDCSQPPPPVLAEVVPPVYDEYKPIYWAGSDAGGQLLSSAEFSFGYVMDYDDCDLNRIAECGDPAMVGGFPICYWSGLLWLLYGRSKDDFQVVRGALVADEKTSDLGLDVMMGRSTSFIYGDGKKSRETALKLLDGFRPMGQTEPLVGDLPSPEIPSRDLQILRKVERAVKRTGSPRAASKKLGLSLNKVKANLLFGKRIRSIGPIKSFKCPPPPVTDPVGIDDYSLRTVRRGLTNP